MDSRGREVGQLSSNVGLWFFDFNFTAHFESEVLPATLNGAATEG